MISLSDDLDIDVSEEINLSDFVTKASKHHWKVGFKFESGHRDPRFGTNGKKYGSNKTFRQIYTELKRKGQDFIDVYFDEVYPYSDIKELGDRLLAEINEEVGIVVDSIITAKDEIFPINKNIETNYTRMKNAEDRLSNQLETLTYQQERFDNSYYEQRERIDSLQYEISNMEENIKRTKYGSFDRRTSGYRLYKLASDELSRLFEDFYNMQNDYDRAKRDYDKMKSNYERESTRYKNSLERKQEAINNLNRIKENRWSTMNSKYESSASEFAESIKDDIVSKARIGELPMQDLALAKSTIEKRKKAGLSTAPRFWATTQLVNSIIVTCTLV